MRGELDDPLLKFTAQLETDRLDGFSETVSLAPMFTAAAAVRAMIRSDRTKQAELAAQLDNADRAAEQGEGAAWRPVRLSVPPRTGILLLQAADAQTRAAPSNRLRERFLSSGIAVTTYDGGLVRASLAPFDLRDEPVQARLVGRLSELAVDSQHGLPLGDHQPGEVLGEMPPLRVAHKQVAELFHGVTHHLRGLYDPWHACTIPGCHGPLENARD